MGWTRIVGVGLVVVGILAAAFPTWSGPLTRATAPTLDLFEAVERRVRGGTVLGLGLILLTVPSLRPWSTSVPTAIFAFMAAALAARLLGMGVDGTVPKQRLMVAVEAAVMTVAALWLWRAGGTAA